MQRHHGNTGSDPTFAATRRSTWEIVRRVAAYLRPYPGLALATMACAILSTLCGFVFPYLTQRIIDQVIVGQRVDLLTPLMFLLLGAFFLRDLFNSLRIRVNNTFEQNVMFDMRRDVFHRLQRLPVHSFDQRASGDLMTRVIEDVNSVERVLIDGQDTRELTLASLRREISVVTQEPFLFNGTIRENILYGNLEATEDVMIAAAQAANGDEFIRRLPDGDMIQRWGNAG